MILVIVFSIPSVNSSSSSSGGTSYSPNYSSAPVASSPQIAFADFDQFVVFDNDVFLHESVKISFVSPKANVRVSVVGGGEPSRYTDSTRTENQTYARERARFVR